MIRPEDLYVGKIVRHCGERKVVRRWFYDNEKKLIIEFVDMTRCKDMRDIELNGSK